MKLFDYAIFSLFFSDLNASGSRCRLFPEWTIQPQLPEPPECVTIAYVLRALNVERSTFYRSIDKKLLLQSGKIGGRPLYLKIDVNWLGVETGRMGKG